MEPEAASVNVTIKVAQDSQRFNGHFTNDPLLPAVAQLSDIILPHVRANFGGGALLSLNRVKWTRPIRPGDEAELSLTRTRQAIQFEITVGGEKACSGKLRLDSEN